MTVLEAVHDMMQRHNGNYNNAEREAWNVRDKTTRPESPEEKFWNSVAVGIVHMAWEEQDARKNRH
jgi:hypothetical protein